MCISLVCAQETRRAQQAAAAEQRIKALESRGVKDPEALKRKQQRQDELEKKAAQSPDDGSGLQVRRSLDQSHIIAYCLSSSLSGVSE